MYVYVLISKMSLLCKEGKIGITSHISQRKTQRHKLPYDQLVAWNSVFCLFLELSFLYDTYFFSLFSDVF